MNTTSEIGQQLKNAGLRITPQRFAVLEAFYKVKNHPTAEKIIQCVHKKNPHIAVGTIYNVIDVLVQNGIINMVKTEKGVMRYDEVLKHHHHLVSNNTDKIQDFYDEELDEILKSYFKKKKIENFTIDNIKLEITGNFEK